MRALVALICVVLTVPAVTVATSFDGAASRAVIEAVLQRHFTRTQPFYKGFALVHFKTFATPPDQQWIVGDLVKDPQVALEIERGVTNEIVTLRNPSVDDYTVAELPVAEDAIDWRVAAEKYPTATVAFQVLTPRFSSDGTYAEVPLRGTVLRGANAGALIQIAYGVRRTGSGDWVYESAVAPCCDRWRGR